MKTDAPVDCRFDCAAWDATDPGRAHRLRATLLAVLSTIALALYSSWLLRPGRRQPGAVRGARHRRAVQRRPAAGFWWTWLGPPAPDTRATQDASRRRRRVHPDLQRAARDRRGDGRRGVSPPWGACTSPSSTTATARRWSSWPAATGSATCGGRCTRAPRRATSTTPSGAPRPPYVLVLDCDHVPHPDLLIKTLPEFADDTWPTCRRRSTTPTLAASRVAAASWSQQALFFGPIARGKDAHEAMFCCGTNVVFRRRASRPSVGLRRLAHRGPPAPRTARACWRSVYVPRSWLCGSARGPGLLRQPATPLGPWLHRIILAAACRPSAAPQGAVPPVGVVLPHRLDGARVPRRCPSCASSPAPSRSPVPPPTASWPRLARTSPLWPPSPASAPASTRSPPTRWPRRRSGSTSTRRTAPCADAPAASS